MHGFRCRTCGAHHELPLAYGPDAPIPTQAIVDAEYAARVELTSDWCVVDGRHFFIRGRLEIPIAGTEQTFAWLVWTSLSEANFNRAMELWEQEGREAEPPWFGWLSTELQPVYAESTVNLRTHVHTRPVGQRPFVEVEPGAHPLAAEQRHGITWARVQAIAEIVLHGP